MIEAAPFVDAARAAGLSRYAGVPCSFLTPFIDHVIDAAGLPYLAAANEGEAVAALAGTALGGAPGVAMMQNSGLGNAVSPLTSLAWVFRIPLLLVVTWRGQPGVTDEPQHALMGTITPRLLDTIDVPWGDFPAESRDVTPALERAVHHLRDAGRPYALVMRKGTVHASPVRRTTRPTATPRSPVAIRVDDDPDPDRLATRAEALRRVLDLTPLAGGTVVIATTGYTGRELYAAADRPNQLYVVGSMGCASALGLGLSLARPDLRVVVLDGDGAALMRLGTFATIGAYGGGNLFHLLLDNQMHESTGGQPTVSPTVRFAGVAAACGYAAASESQGLASIDALLAEPHGSGPHFLHLRIRPGISESLPRPAITPVQVRDRFMAHIGAAFWSPR